MRILALIATLMLLASIVSAAATATGKPVVTLDAKDMPIDQAMTELGRQAGARIVCDSDVKGNVIGQFKSIELENALDVITSTNNLKWQKVYLPAPAQADQKPTLEQVKARAQAATALTSGSFVVYDPVTGKQKVFVEQDAAAPKVDPGKLGLKPVYLVTKPKVETKSAQVGKPDKDSTARLQSLQEERAKLLAEMTPEQRVGAMQQEMMYMTQMNPALRQQMVLDEYNARHNMDPQMRDTYWDVMRDTYRSLRDQGLLPEWDHRRGRDRGDRDQQN
ncbi:MAG: DUF4974 domain-containing protein [Armatimonadota bacterium]|nr:DUF4974 domain-containing protein [Armatimonadota bacterium]